MLALVEAASLEGGALHRPVGLVKTDDELRLLLLGQKTRLCRVDVLQTQREIHEAFKCSWGNRIESFPPPPGCLPRPAASHQPLELVLGEAHVFGGDAVVEVEAGVEDQRVVSVEGVVGVVLPEPAPRKR